MNSVELVESFSEFKDFKNIDRPTMMRVLEDVFKTLLRKKYGSDQNFDIIVNTEKGDLEIWRHRMIVEDGKVEDKLAEVELSVAKTTEAYVFSKLVLDKNYKRIDINPIMLDRIIMEYKTIMPSNSELRLIARSEPWRSLWSTNPDCFRIVGNEQNALIMFSKKYAGHSTVKRRGHAH